MIPCKSGWMDNWFSPKYDCVRTNNRPFLADLVLYECAVETNACVVEESLLKQLFIKIQLSTFIISANFKILQFLNKGVVWALKGAKFIILNAFFLENRRFLLRISCNPPSNAYIIQMRTEYSKISGS